MRAKPGRTQCTPTSRREGGRGLRRGALRVPGYLVLAFPDRIQEREDCLAELSGALLMDAVGSFVEALEGDARLKLPG